MADPRRILHQTWLDLSLRWLDRHSHQQLKQLARAVAEHARPDPAQPPVVFFRASTGILRLSLNAAFGLLASWGLRLSGVPVAHFTCRSGMSRCVQGLNRLDYAIDPPCRTCVAQAGRTYAGAPVHWFDYSADDNLARALQGRSLAELATLEHAGVPLGKLVMPSIRWALRRHHLPDDEPTRRLLRQFHLSAYRVAGEFGALLDRVEPQAVVVFNGILFPEAIARFVAQQRGLRTITYEVGFQPYSAFFTSGEATAYPIHIPATFDLSSQQDDRLDAYLEKRFQGKFTMAGIRFWPEMHGLDSAFDQKAAGFEQIVPVFTNVIFDTSQVHANTVFPHMFAWLDALLEIIRAHPETLFVIRAHPDEMRAGKESRESVREWAARQGADSLPNVIFIRPDERISSYEVIQRAKFVLVYNSSIGLEAALLGAPVICGGNARYTQYPTTFFPGTPAAFRQECERFLRTDRIDVPEEFRRNARRFLYYQLYRASLPFGEYLQEDALPGFVRFRPFDWQALTPAHSATIRTVMEGVLEGKPFLLSEEETPAWA